MFGELSEESLICDEKSKKRIQVIISGSRFCWWRANNRVYIMQFNNNVFMFVCHNCRALQYCDPYLGRINSYVASNDLAAHKEYHRIILFKTKFYILGGCKTQLLFGLYFLNNGLN